MDKWFGLIKKYWWAVVLALFFFIVFVPFVINICFLKTAPCKHLVADWGSGDVLSYYGSVLGLLGTVGLSMLALYQNQEIKKEADKREELLKSQIHSPQLDLQYTSPLFYISNLEFTLRNISNNLADNITVSDIKVYDKTRDLINSISNCRLNRKSLAGGDYFIFIIEIDEIKATNLKIEFIVSCQDKFDIVHKYRALLIKLDSEKSNTKLEFNRI